MPENEGEKSEQKTRSRLSKNNVMCACGCKRMKKHSSTKLK